MTPVRAAGSFLGVLTGLLAFLFQYDKPVPACEVTATCLTTQSSSSLPTVWLAVVGAMLLAMSFVSLGGFRVTFYGGAILSVMVLAADVALRGDFPAYEWELVAVLSLVTLVVDLVASRPARALSEKDSPLNLPVFG